MKGKVAYLMICLVATFCCQISCFADSKSDRQKPKWVTQVLPESKSGTYIFVRSHGQGPSLAGAKQQAFVSMSQKLEIERWLKVDTNFQVREQLSQSQSSTNSEYKQEITHDVTEEGYKLRIVCREIDDYWEVSNGVYEVDILYTVADTNVYGGSYDDKIIVTSKYGMAGFLSIIPSVGQFYKGSVVKGGLILAGGLATAGGIILCENTRASYVRKMQEQPQYAAGYGSLADSWLTGKNICIGAASAIYIYNLIDAFVSPGAKRVTVKKGRANLSAVPYIDSNTAGIGLALKF